MFEDYITIYITKRYPPSVAEKHYIYNTDKFAMADEEELTAEQIRKQLIDFISKAEIKLKAVEE